MSTTKEKRLTRVAMLRKHGVTVPMTAALDLLEAAPGLLKDSKLPRRYATAFHRRGWIKANSQPSDMSELMDYEITEEGLKAVELIKLAEEEFAAQPPKRKYVRKGAIPG